MCYWHTLHAYITAHQKQREASLMDKSKRERTPGTLSTRRRHARLSDGCQRTQYTSATHADTHTTIRSAMNLSAQIAIASADAAAPPPFHYESLLRFPVSGAVLGVQSDTKLRDGSMLPSPQSHADVRTVWNAASFYCPHAR